MSSLRRVRRLRLGAPDAASLARGRLLVEDALRTAALPDADGGRIYVVRRFDLGAIDPDRPPGVVAMVIERRFAALRARAVPADSPAAVTADAVVFDGPLAPYTLLVRRLASGPAREWFWPLAVRGFSPALARDAAARVAIAGALGTPGRAAALLIMAASLEPDEVEVLAGALLARDGDALLAGLGGPVVTSAPAGVRSSLAAPWSALVRRWAGRWGTADPRTAWLAAAALCAHVPAWSTSAALMTRAAAEVVAALAGEQEADPAGSPGADASSPPRQSNRDDAIICAPPAHIARSGMAQRSRTDRSPPPREGDGEGDGEATAAHALPPPAPVALPVERPAAAMDAPSTQGTTNDRPGSAVEPIAAAIELRPARAPWSGTLAPTAAGGLLFLVRPLARLGFADWLAERTDTADAALAARLLRRLGVRLGVPADDVALTSWDLGDALAPASEEQAALDAWCLRLARWARRHARLGLRAIVKRPARWTATRTHVDVVFPLQAADARVRAAGLDVNPGWTRWLGRVIQFHYVEGTIA